MDAYKSQLKNLKERKAQLTDILAENKDYVERANVMKEIKAIVDILTGTNEDTDSTKAKPVKPVKQVKPKKKDMPKIKVSFE
jgi:hypothetical protein